MKEEKENLLKTRAERVREKTLSDGCLVWCTTRHPGNFGIAGEVAAYDDYHCDRSHGDDPSEYGLVCPGCGRWVWSYR